MDLQQALNEAQNQTIALKARLLDANDRIENLHSQLVTLCQVAKVDDTRQLYEMLQSLHADKADGGTADDAA